MRISGAESCHSYHSACSLPVEQPPAIAATSCDCPPREDHDESRGFPSVHSDQRTQGRDFMTMGPIADRQAPRGRVRSTWMEPVDSFLTHPWPCAGAAEYRSVDTDSAMGSGAQISHLVRPSRHRADMCTRNAVPHRDVAPDDLGGAAWVAV